LIDDMHDGTIAQGDAWLSSNLPTILASPEYTSGSTAVFVTFDEGNDGGQTGENCVANTSDSSCHVLTIVISPSTAAGSTSATMFSHYSLLATTEQLLGLPALGRAASAATMTAAFNL
ncbi:MAG TPA: alkaline phosphatase family protein, partial [Trebonia sp.]|nr:alkaline phosphatase family protein [Trebonia sp.]